MSNSNITRALTVIGCFLIFVMACFHGSGIHYISDLVVDSNAESFVKKIFPVLFAHPSIQLFGLAALGVLTLYMKFESQKILSFIAIMILIDSFLAFYLGATLPGLLLLLITVVFGMAAIKKS